MSDNEVIVRPTIADVFELRCSVLEKMKQLSSLEDEVKYLLDPIGGFPPFYIDWNRGLSSCRDRTKSVDVFCWLYVVRLLNLQRYMLCSEYEKVLKDIGNGDVPEFTPEKVQSWVLGLKSLIHENIQTMFKSVFNHVVSDHYYTGRDKKKRNNNGIDTNFILYTNDYFYMYGYGYCQNKPTITDDLEKVCYILDGEDLPDKTLKQVMAADKKRSGNCPYFSIKVCKNGNTHYSMDGRIRDALNKIGPDGNLIGEKVRIKIFESEEWVTWR